MKTGFIRAAESKRSRQLRGVFSVGKLVQNPTPIVFGINVLAGPLSRWDCMRQRHGIHCRNFPPKVTGFEVESRGYLTVTGYGGSYLQFRNLGSRRTRLHSVQTGSPPKVIASGSMAFSCCSKVELSMSHRI